MDVCSYDCVNNLCGFPLIYMYTQTLNIAVLPCTNAQGILFLKEFTYVEDVTFPKLNYHTILNVGSVNHFYIRIPFIANTAKVYCVCDCLIEKNDFIPKTNCIYSQYCQVLFQ